MSEYQYYEFRAIDRPLSASDRSALRDLSTRAEITHTSFVNTYEWGDFKSDPLLLMKRWFDLHVYWANWGTHRLMMRFPKQLVDPSLCQGMLVDVDDATVHVSGDIVILDITREEIEVYGEDGSGWMAALAPLREDFLAGDLRPLYLAWLMATEADVFEVDEPEPLPGIGPLSVALKAFVAFFDIDADLVEAAAERDLPLLQPDTDTGLIASLPDGEKTNLLIKLYNGDPHVRAELRNNLRASRRPVDTKARTLGALRARAQAIGEARQARLAEEMEAERRREVAEADKVRRARLDAVGRRGTACGAKSRSISGKAMPPAIFAPPISWSISNISLTKTAQPTRSCFGSPRSASVTSKSEP